MPANTLHSKCKLLVNHFCSHAKFISWGKEIKIAKKLLKLNPEVKFWKSLQTPTLIFSLSWFLTKAGKDFLLISKLKKNLSLPNSSGRAILEEKIGEDKEISKKPKTIFEFLSHGEN